MFQWKERCVGGKCRGRGGADLGQAQKEQKGWVALGPYFPFGKEASTLIHRGTLPQPRWGWVFWDLVHSEVFWGAWSPWLEAPELSSPLQMSFMEPWVWFNLVWIFRLNLGTHPLSPSPHGQLQEIPPVSSSSGNEKF